MTAKENLPLNWRDKILAECIGHEPPDGSRKISGYEARLTSKEWQK